MDSRRMSGCFAGITDFLYQTTVLFDNHSFLFDKKLHH